MGLVFTIGPFATLGADKLVVRDISGRGVCPAVAVTSALVTVSVGALLATGALAALQGILLPQVPVSLVVALGIGELLANGSVLVCVRAFFATGAARSAGISHSVISGVKLLAVGVFAVSGSRDPAQWARDYAVFALLAAGLCVAYTYSRVGRPVLEDYSFLRRAKDGLPFSLNVSAAVSQNDLDKVILVRSGFSEQAGLYTVAYRLVNIAMLPVNAVMSGVYARYFELGAEGGIVATSRFARRLLLPLSAYAVVVGLLLAMVSPLVPLIVGPQYEGATPMLVALAPLALLKVMQYLPAEALTGAGDQPIRAACAFAAAATNAALCILLIPDQGVQGALAATYAAEVVGVVLVMLAVRRAKSRTARAGRRGSASGRH